MEERDSGVRIPVNRAAENRVTEEETDRVEATTGEGTVAESPENGGMWQERYLRLAAELDNSKKAYERAFTRRTQQERERIVRDLLPLADNLERALAHVSPTEQHTGLYSGVELTLRTFLKTLAKYGVERVEALGEPFDPAVHDAIATLPHPSFEPGTVMRVEQPGYKIDGRLLRPAQVIVTAG